MMKAIITAACAALLLGGCALAQERIGPTAKRVTDKYCDPLNATARVLLRAEVNAAIKPHKLTLECVAKP